MFNMILPHQSNITFSSSWILLYKLLCGNFLFITRDFRRKTFLIALKLEDRRQMLNQLKYFFPQLIAIDNTVIKENKQCANILLFSKIIAYVFLHTARIDITPAFSEVSVFEIFCMFFFNSHIRMEKHYYNKPNSDF